MIGAAGPTRHGDSLTDIAHHIGLQLAAEAIWDGECCTWAGHNIAGATSVAAQPSAGGFVYDGSAGIALFLAELTLRNPAPELERVVLGAVNHSLRSIASVHPSHAGFFEGRSGIAYTAGYIGKLFGIKSFRHASSAIIAAMRGLEAQDRGLDVIGGAAGAIPALIRLSQLTNDDEGIESAKRFGQHLVDVARRETHGWSWDNAMTAARRNFTGLAHGASGMASALLDVFLVTGDDAFLYAADQALRYEAVYFDGRMGSWRNPRSPEILELERAGTCQKEIVERVLYGAPVTEDYECPYQWCYGAPGMIPVRLRMARVLDEPTYLGEAMLGIRHTFDRLPTQANYSLCHGAAGNADALLRAAELSSDLELRDRVRLWARDISTWYWTTPEKRSSGRQDGGRDATLMLGDAGFGYFCLRVSDESVPSIIFLDAGSDGAVPVRGWRRHHDEQFATEYFPQSVAAFTRLTGQSLTEAAFGTKSDASPPHRLYVAILSRIVDTSDEEGSRLLGDASLVERAAFVESLRLDEFLTEKAQWLARRLWADAGVESCVQSGTSTRVIQPEYDWPGWLGMPVGVARPAVLDGHAVLLYRKHSRIQAVPVPHGIEDVLRMCKTPVTVAAMLDHVDWTGESVEAVEAFRATLRRTVQWLYDIGALVPTGPFPSENVVSSPG
jgi:lantibiotic biosynthesis protein